MMITSFLNNLIVSAVAMVGITQINPDYFTKEANRFYRRYPRAKPMLSYELLI